MKDSVVRLALLADMNLSPHTVQAVQERGWNIVRVSEVLSVSASDEEVLAFARREGRVIITQDLDFSRLVALSGYDRPSLVTLRLSVSDPATIAGKLLEVLPRLEHALCLGCAVTVEDVAVRIRLLPIQL